MLTITVPNERFPGIPPLMNLEPEPVRDPHRHGLQRPPTPTGRHDDPRGHRNPAGSRLEPLIDFPDVPILLQDRPLDDRTTSDPRQSAQVPPQTHPRGIPSETPRRGDLGVPQAPPQEAQQETMGAISRVPANNSTRANAPHSNRQPVNPVGGSRSQPDRSSGTGPRSMVGEENSVAREATHEPAMNEQAAIQATSRLQQQSATMEQGIPAVTTDGGAALEESGVRHAAIAPVMDRAEAVDQEVRTAITQVAAAPRPANAENPASLPSVRGRRRRPRGRR
jgi:hypothetical protein